MSFPYLAYRFRKLLPLAALASFVAASATAHEAWLLTPAEIEALAAEPMPALFSSHLWLGIAALVGGLATAIALRAEEFLRPYEERLAARLAVQALTFGPFVLRLGIAVMLILAGLGGLPRHGTAQWAEPTFLVPDMQLALVPGWGWLAILQIMLALFLVAGLFTRIAGLALIALAMFGLALFGSTFLAYTPHFAAPGLMLALAGGGAFSLDRNLGIRDPFGSGLAFGQTGWRVAQILIGGGFLYLAIAYKLTQPTLLIAILDHGNLPTFGLSNTAVALVMTGIEIICGALLILGRLTRPVALVIIGAITTLAIGLNETPLFHANLYAVMVFLALAGRTWPEPAPAAAPFERRLA